MAWLDRDQAPARFTVVTSVLSGLLLTAIVNTIRDGISVPTLLALFAVTSVGVAAVSWTPGQALTRAPKRSRRAFFMTSAFRSKYYVAAFVHSLHGTLDRDGIDLILKVPDRDYDASAQCHHLRRILERRRDYLGGIIFASEVQRFRNDLIMFCRKSRLPIVFTDIEPFDRESDYPENTAFVGYDTGQLGELAGNWLVTRLRDRQRPHVLIIGAREHDARQQRCEQALRSGLPDVTVTTKPDCQFIRSRAYDEVRAYLAQLNEHQQLDAIFCTNDEMALGAVDALAPRPPASPAILVVGVDGVPEARTLIDIGDSPLQATVLQDPHRLAVSVVDLLEKMHAGGSVPKRTFLSADVYDITHRSHAH
jgi:ribose transport system substrate-binding protein